MSTKRTMSAFLITAILIITSCAAGTSFDWNHARQIQTGMSQAQVAAIMGQPYAVSSTGDRTRWVWSYATAFGGSKVMSVDFDQNKKVVSVPPIPDTF